MLRDIIKGMGQVHFLLEGERGQVILERWGTNMVVTTGLAHIADQLASTPAQAAIGYMAIGSGSGAAFASGTTLVAELSRVALTTRTASAAIVTYTATFTAGQGTGTLYEAGLLNASTNGTLLARLVYGIITKAAGDTLTVTWTLTFADDGV